MRNLTLREKILFLLIGILFTVVVYFGYQLNTLGFFTIKYDVPPPDWEPQTFEKSIKTANVIFTCETEDEGKYIRFRVDRILYKNNDYKFPYNIGEIYGDLSDKKRPNMYYGDGRLLFLFDGPIVMRSYTIINDEIKPHRGDDSYKVMSIKEISNLINMYRNR
jgi:hypothetical protein